MAAGVKVLFCKEVTKVEVTTGSSLDEDGPLIIDQQLIFSKIIELQYLDMDSKVHFAFQEAHLVPPHGR